MAKGFHQQAGLRYDETFNPVVKPTTICLVLSFAPMSKWIIKQLDVQKAFLHDILHEEVYIDQLPGFLDPSSPTHVCKLQKLLCGLKQAP